ncbi:subtilisin-like serine protease [Ceratobasidium sp. 395]|nr:subtilisin-like serine protease [Ceratobasidium sp. 395]
MRFSVAFGALVLAAPAFGAPTLVPIIKRAGSVKPNSFIVTFDDAASKDAFMNTGPKFSQSDSSVTYDYDIIPAAAMIVHPSDMRMVQSLSGVKSIEPDGIVSIDYEIGLDGFDETGFGRSTGSSERLEKRTNQGEGVDVYGIDTGIYTGHNCFGGRARWGATFGGYADKDGHGHGTHTAGTAAGSGFFPGVAIEASLIAVKVLSDSGSGSNSDVIAGVQYVMTSAQESGRQSVANMSLGGTRSSSLDDAVRNAIAHGVHFAVAAGNESTLASTSSPAGVDEANTIGAVDGKNERAYFSNFGPVLDLWAPGVDIVSAGITGPDSTSVMSGTSMASPGVASIMAACLSMEENRQLSPADLSQKMKKNAKHVVRDVGGVPLVGSTDLLAVPC